MKEGFQALLSESKVERPLIAGLGRLPTARPRPSLLDP